MQYNQFDQDAAIDGSYIVESDNTPRYGGYSNNRASRRAMVAAPGLARLKTYFLFGAGTVTVIVVGWGLFTVRQFMPLVGILALLTALLLLACAGAWAVISVVRYATRADFYPMEENGAYLRNALGRVTPLAPMIAAPARVSKATNKVEITPAVPTLFDLLESGEIAPGRLEMVMGYDAGQLHKGILQMVIGAWPGTHAIAGRGRSGKTRRVIGEIAQVLISGGYVIVCDPHYAKGDSLSKQLEPLAKYLRIARGEQEIVAASRDFLAEMTRRETSPDVQFSPWAIYYDEWARLMTTEKIEDDDRAVLIEVAESCSEQYAGFNGFCALISQAWTGETCGGTRIRRGLQAAFVHQISPEYAAFFFRARKWQNRADEIKRRECIYKDGNSEISEIITLGVPDDTASRVSVYLASLGYPAIEAPAQAPRLPDYREPGRLGEQTAYIALPAPLSPAQDIRPDYSYSRTPGAFNGESENTVNALPAQCEEMETLQPKHESVTLQGESFTAQAPAQDAQEVTYTREQETAILKAAFQLAKESNGRVTRSDIKERLGWNNRGYPIIKAVCDKHEIAKQ